MKDTGWNDQRLVREMRDGSETAFAEFFDAYFPRLYRFALARVGREDAAEEIAQAAIVVGIRKIGTWRGEAALCTWLCSICRHEIGAYCARTNRREVNVLDDEPRIRVQLEALSARADGPHQEYERRDLARLVQLTLDYLPPRYGDVLEWKYIQGLTMQEIAARLGGTTKAIESLLARAREAFREGFVTLTGLEQ
jgi:RNA polymerase sigma-70 factor (ECF subfamily)